MHTNNTQTNTNINTVKRDSDGKPILPLKISEKFTLLSLGTISQKPGFHTKQNIFPVGYVWQESQRAREKEQERESKREKGKGKGKRKRKEA